MACSCSHWWHAPIYVSVSVVLAIVAMTTPSQPQAPSQSQTPISPMTHKISTNASRSLRKLGFNFMATLLQISPELLLPPSESTIFVIHDNAISNTSLPPWLMKDLLHYHTLPSKLSLTDLLNGTQGTCVPTLFLGKNVSVTKLVPQEELVEINGVVVSHPDVFNHGLYSIHGVSAPFFDLHQLEQQQDWDLIELPKCGLLANGNVTAEGARNTRNRALWNRIVRQLSSNGYTSFAIGLHSILDGIFRDYCELESLTIFAPVEFGYIAAPMPILERIVRLHIMPERFEYNQLLSLPVKAHLRTLDEGSVLEVTEECGVRQVFGINGVEITAPDDLTEEEFVVHGISEPFDRTNLG